MEGHRAPFPIQTVSANLHAHPLVCTINFLVREEQRYPEKTQNPLKDRERYQTGLRLPIVGSDLTQFVPLSSG